MKKLTYILLVFYIFNFSSLYSDDFHTNLKKKADRGDAQSQNDLGHMYLYGFIDYNIEQNDSKAIYYLNKAAAQNQVNAMTTVGWVYFEGSHGAPVDYEEAIGWNKKASDLGCATASYNMGLFYYGGLANLDQNLNEAKKFWLLSASQYLEPKNTCRADPDELLKEINQYNQNPSIEMKKLRDFFINLLKSEPI